jgi:hypothetical protein
MTRWNAPASTFTLLHLLFTLSSPTFAAAFRVQARHNGKSHKNHIHRDIDARQEVPNATFAGIRIISNLGATMIPTAAPTPPSPPPDEQFETISAMDPGALGEAAAISMTRMTAASISIGQATIKSFTTPVFPITVIQIPIYTICPDTPGYINATSTLPLNATALYGNSTATGNTTAYLPQIVSAIPLPVNATALLPDGSYTTLLSQSLPSPAILSVTQAPALNARIILGTNGCQTLYSASTTQMCSTVIARGGQLPVTVSNCSQLVTFSSSSTNATPLGNCPSTLVCPSAPTSPASQTISGMPIHETVSPALAAGGGRNAGLGIAFFAAPWQEIAAGVVPGLVQVANCADESGNNCSTSSERWSVSTATSTATTTRTVRYAGVSSR